MKLARHREGPEIFYSIQGEGPQQGCPSIFVRTSRCNLYCSWCDTPYTWNWVGSKFQHESAQQFDRVRETITLNATEVVEKIRSFPCRRVIFTGGEPLLQQEDLVEVMQQLRLCDSSYVFEVETNATQLPSSSLDAFIQLYAVSPKLSNSGVKLSLRLQSQPLSFFVNDPKSILKFVISQKADLQEVLQLVQQYNLPSGRVYLMPEGTSSEELNQGSPLVVEACQLHGFRYCDRLHIRLFGSKPGV